MVLYHYSVDSYRGGSSLINDYKKQYRFAEPYLLALQKSEDCFWAVFYSNMAVSRELCALKLRKYENYVKDAVEGIFEFIRLRDFPECSASRVGCVYYCETKEEAVAYLREDCLDSGDFSADQVKLLEVMVADERVFRYDQAFYNRAIEVMEHSCDLHEVFSLAGRYFSQKRSDAPIVEILSDGKNTIINELPIL